MNPSDNFDNPAWPPLSCVHRMLIAADADVRVLEIRRREA